MAPATGPMPTFTPHARDGADPYTPESREAQFVARHMSARITGLRPAAPAWQGRHERRGRRSGILLPGGPHPGVVRDPALLARVLRGLKDDPDATVPHPSLEPVTGPMPMAAPVAEAQPAPQAAAAATGDGLAFAVELAWLYRGEAAHWLARHWADGARERAERALGIARRIEACASPHELACLLLDLAEGSTPGA